VPLLLAAADRDMTLPEAGLQREEETRRRLKMLVPAEVSSSCTIDTLLAHGKPWREILRVAADRQSELIVMGVQGRGPVDLMLFGSTTQHVVRQAACPVLTRRKH
jgi:nucleotide-binding universal stress UspA family protein